MNLISENDVAAIAADLHPSDQLNGLDATTALQRSLAGSWWSGPIRLGGKTVAIIGLTFLGGRRHLVWLASTPALFSRPSALIREGRAWLEQVYTKETADLVAVCPPSNKKLARLLKAWGFRQSPYEDPSLGCYPYTFDPSRR